MKKALYTILFSSLVSFLVSALLGFCITAGTIGFSGFFKVSTLAPAVAICYGIGGGIIGIPIGIILIIINHWNNKKFMKNEEMWNGIKENIKSK
jgi:hypothetical protein